MKIAIIEDDINMRKSLEIALKEHKEFEIVSFRNGKDALKKIDDTFKLIITDINMPYMDGLEFLEKLNGNQEAIIITGNATLNNAIKSIQLGVKDFLVKPFETQTLLKAIKRSQKAQKIVRISPKNSKTTIDTKDFIAKSPALERALNMAKKAASTDASVLLLGDSGVGKELFANFIHKNSPRSHKRLVALNMAAIPEALLESELFGYEKGAFTDAASEKIGKFELSNNSTLFLDEIGEMPVNLQAKILRVLQEKEITKLGSNKVTKINTRIISATNINIEEKIQKKEFREDLYYRLQTIPIYIPPLKDRKEEILPLAKSILEKTILAYNLKPKRLSKEAQDELLDYKWPGNIRELMSTVERAGILSEEEEITTEDLFLNAKKSSNIDNMERDLIREVISEYKSDTDKILQTLGFTKDILEKKCQKYGISLK